MKNRETLQFEKQIRMMKREKDLLVKQVRELTTKNIMLKNLNEQLVKQNKLLSNDVGVLETELDCVKAGR